MDSLAERRSLARQANQMNGVIDCWTPPQTNRAKLTLEVSFEHYITYDIDDGSGDAPALFLRVRREGKRKALDLRELYSIDLPPDLKRLLMLATGRAVRKAYVVPPVRVALALEILHAHPEWALTGARLSDVPVGMALTRAAVRRREGYQPPAVAHRGRSTERERALPDVLTAFFKAEDGSMSVPVVDAVLYDGPVPFVLVPEQQAVFPLHPAVRPDVAARVIANAVAPVPPQMWDGAFRRVKARLLGTGLTLPSRADLGLPPAPEAAFSVRIHGEPLSFEARLEAAYDDAKHSVSTAALSRLAEQVSPGGPLRDIDSEQAAILRLTTSGLTEDPETGTFTGSGERAFQFWDKGLAALRAKGTPPIAVFLSEKLLGVRVRKSPVRVRVHASLVSGLLDAAIAFESEEMAAEMSALRAAVARKQRWVELRDGTLAPLSDKALELASATHDLVNDAGRAELSIPQIGLLEHWASAADQAHLDPAVEDIRSRLRALDVRPAEIPQGLAATLRPYQRAGLAWLQFLCELGTGGILADDMGLGKTLMTLALLVWKKERGKAAGPALVVCPTSVVGNWAREAARFAPGLKVLVLTGADRAARIAVAGDFDLVVTSFALLRLDIDELSGIAFHTAIIDEAQNIKNAAAATTHAARRLRADQRLALTGTPVENRLGELWSILDFANRGMLGTERKFEERFERPIVQDRAGPAAAELRSRVRPFLLRRTKAQVLTELPPKEEIDAVCLPAPAQRTAYDALAAVLLRDVEGSIASMGLKRSGLIVLTALLRLRQMCCDPRLVDASRPASMSAKRTAFLSLVRELRDEGRRALVFSQFVELFTLWRKDLDSEGISYEYLDGSTRNRDEVVRRFQEGDATLFLLSLKAGGSGLNLTAADTVIHCDPWWNPAVEAQATDRTHRMGQTRAVTVYKLIVRGTIEEKIAELKAAKRSLADAVIHEDEGALRGLQEEDVRLLLAGIDASVGDGDEAEILETQGVPVSPHPDRLSPPAARRGIRRA
ncbi:MAG: SNF2-related protein [Polyangiaceae bacterium]